MADSWLAVGIVIAAAAIAWAGWVIGTAILAVITELGTHGMPRCDFAFELGDKSDARWIAEAIR
jgi:hypothetical protein